MGVGLAATATSRYACKAQQCEGTWRGNNRKAARGRGATAEGKEGIVSARTSDTDTASDAVPSPAVAPGVSHDECVIASGKIQLEAQVVAGTKGTGEGEVR